MLAFAIALTQSVVPLWGAHRRDRAAMEFATTAAIGQLVFIALAFACLTYAFVTSDFSVAIVVANSHTAKPLIYKISGVWANHEGSMLLWVLILALFGAAVAVFGDNLPDTLQGARAGRSGHDRPRLPRLRRLHIQSIPAGVACARSMAKVLIRSSRTPASHCIHHSSIWAMSASRWRSRSLSRR